MASVTAFIRTERKKGGKANIRFRLRDGRNIQLFHKSELRISPELWDPKRQDIKAKVICDPQERNNLPINIALRKKLILEIYNEEKDKLGLTSEWLEKQIDWRLNPNKYKRPEQTIAEAFHEFINSRKYSEWRQRSFRVVIRALQRFEIYYRISIDKEFSLTFERFTPVALGKFEKFLRDEHKLAASFPMLYRMVPESRRPKPRGQNAINAILIKLRTFFIWAYDQEKTSVNPFKKYPIEECVYGTPYYITIEERNKIYDTNLSRHPKLEIQRDIFVFHCLIGCRISDLYTLRRHNIINGAIEYIARKTLEGRPVTVRVPLSPVAIEILDRYKNDSDYLFPLISQQKYNVAIKKIFLAAGLKRSVTILNPTTRAPEVKPLHEIASSHIARRCFVGNLYKKVKDPNLVGALSGHKEGSKAFARYRDIDEEMKKELVSLLE